MMTSNNSSSSPSKVETEEKDYKCVLTYTKNLYANQARRRRSEEQKKRKDLLTTLTGLHEGFRNRIAEKVALKTKPGNL
jgi:hypothetical protein